MEPSGPLIGGSKRSNAASNETGKLANWQNNSLFCHFSKSGGGEVPAITGRELKKFWHPEY